MEPTQSSILKKREKMEESKMMNYQMFAPTKVLFGAGKLNALHEQNMPGKKGLLVISNGKSMKSTGILARTEQELQLAGVDYILFDQIQANPLKSTVMAGAAMARKENCDFVLALRCV